MTADSPKSANDTRADTERRARDRRAGGGGKKSGVTVGTGRVSGGLALILAGIAFAGTAYLWYTLVYERQDLLAIDVPATLETLNTETGELREAVADTEEQVTSLVETQETLKSALEKIQNDLGRHRADWIVAETEQLLLIANRRLQLARDVASALAALRAADRNLELLANPHFIVVRRQLAREIGLLESLEKTDIAGATLRLGSLAEGVDRLPLSQELRRQVLAYTESNDAARTELSAADDGWGTARSMWRDVLSLVRIRRHDGNERPLLPPDQQYFVRENLRLVLYGAQQALLQGHVQTYQQNINTAGRWLNDYFDGDAQTVAAARAELEKLKAMPVMVELPDIAGSLAALRKASGRRS